MFKAEYIQIGKHFDTRTGDNLACRHCQTILVNTDVITHYKMMDEFREWFGRSMQINSGYRCPEYNALVGGEDNSYHMKGIAADWALPRDFYQLNQTRKREYLNNCKKKWYEICGTYGVNGGVGFYNSFVHFDSRTEKRAFWDNSIYFRKG